MADDPFMKQCIYDNCPMPPEWEHAFIYSGRQVNEKWAIVPVCTFHHRREGLDKDYNRYRALERATDEDLAKYPRVDWKQLKKHLRQAYDHKGKSKTNS